MKVTIKSVKGIEFNSEYTINENEPLLNLQKMIYKRYNRLNLNRQRLKFNSSVLDQSGKTLNQLGIKNGAILEIKDLGPQISWRKVFLIEYFGPILIHSLVYFNPKFFYSNVKEYTTVQTIAFVMVLVHYIKRELETIYVHRFSHSTMPLTNLPKNCFHYWVISGIFMAYYLYKPITSVGKDDAGIFWGSLFGFCFGEAANLYCHLILRNLRSEGSTERNIPYGFGFNLVSCPNYFFEFMAWTCFTIFTGSYAAAFFMLLGTAQMFVWARKKHIQYRKEFVNYPKERKAMFPYIA